MATVENGSNKKSIWAKMGSNFVKFIIYTAKPSNWAEIGTRGEKFVGRFLALPFNAIIYTASPSSWRKSWGERWSDCKNGLGHVISGKGNDSLCDRVGISFIKFFTYLVKPSNWPKPFGKMWHDIKNGGRYVMGKPPEKFNSPVETTQGSKDLGIKIIGYKDGKVTFLASKTLTGDIPHMNDEHMKRLEAFNNDKKNKYSNVHINREGNKVTITIDVEKIIKELKREIDAQGLEVSERQIKILAIARIEREVDRNLKGIAQITGGEFKRHKDLKLLYGIAEKLYKEHDNKKEKPVQSPAQGSNETLSSVTGQSEEILRMAAPLEKPVQGSNETLSSVSNEQELSETFRWLFDDGSLPEIPEAFVDSCETVRSVPSETFKPSVGNSSPEVNKELSVNSSREAARKAIEKAKERQKQSPRNVGIGSEGLKQIFQPGRQLTGGCDAEAESKWQEKQEQGVGPQGSGKQKGFSI